MQLSRVVPWGRSLDEYKRMFLLSDAELSLKKVLDVGGGPSSFNAEAHTTITGARVLSLDPIYKYTGGEISGRIAATLDLVEFGIREHIYKYVWGRSTFASPEALISSRMSSMRQFLRDYECARGTRYVPGNGDKLQYEDLKFDLALSSHFLLLYSELLGIEFHRRATLEMLRVAREVRIFPVVDLDGRAASALGAVREAANSVPGVRTEVVRTEYEFQRGAHTMLRIYRSSE